MNLKSYMLAPIVVPQALWVAARAARLPEASGARSGEVGHGRPIDVLILGDSSAAGVGVDHQDEALGGRLAAELAKRYLVKWQIVAKSGATAKSTFQRVEALPPRKVDFVLIALGVNDVKNGVPFTRWRRDYTALLDLLSEKFDAPRICMSGVPPMRFFPILPRPLSQVLGARAERFDGYLREVAAARPRMVHLPLDFTLEIGKMARDNFHPGPEIYAAWAARAAAVFED